MSEEKDKIEPTIIVKIEMSTMLGIEIHFDFKTPCNVVGEIRQAKASDGQKYGGMTIKVEPKLSMDFIATLKDALRKFDAEFGKYMN